jgi:hypothetical protein
MDFVGVTPLEKQTWMNSGSYNPDAYWKAGSAIRRSVQARMISTEFKNDNTFILMVTDPIWRTWFSYGATELMVMAKLPGDYDNGPYDPRRIFLPLDKNFWDAKKRTLEIKVQDSIVRVVTPQKLNK